jgi:Trypsin-like peptidase domain
MSEKMGVCTIVPKDQNGFRPLVFGMGILFGDREVVTCAHVVSFALGLRAQRTPGKATVRVCFPFADGCPCVGGTLDPESWFPAGRRNDGKPSDIALIRLKQDAPRSVERAVPGEYIIDATAKAYGFRGMKDRTGVWRSHPDGEWSEGKIVGPQPGGRAQFDGLRRTGAGAEKGFSGSGVYDPRLDAVVGMVVETDKDKTRKIAQFIDVPSLKQAIKVIPGPGPTSSGSEPPAPARTVLAETVELTRQRMGELETYLRQVAESLTPADPDAGPLSYLQALLGEDTTKARLLRAAFGFPTNPQKSRSNYGFVFSDELAVQPLVAVLVQRVFHILWRYEVTLDKHVKADWRHEALTKVRALSTLCESSLVARRPTLLDMSAALKFEKELKSFTEAAPDSTLYAVLRAISHAQYHTLPVDRSVVNKVTKSALDFVHNYIHEVVEDQRQIDDSSNAWWAVRTGLHLKDIRFRALLTRIATKFNDVKVPSSELYRQAAVPEIYVALRTASYTLSNIQNIFEFSRVTEHRLAEQLHGILQVMLSRLLNTQRNNQLYLASVHYEGLRNYLDYVNQQNLADVSPVE